MKMGYTKILQAIGLKTVIAIAAISWATYHNVLENQGDIKHIKMELAERGEWMKDTNERLYDLEMWRYKNAKIKMVNKND